MIVIELPVKAEVNKIFKDIVGDFAAYLSVIKNKFEQYDFRNVNSERRISFIKRLQKRIFKKFDMYFARIQNAAVGFSEEEYKLHQKYAQKTLWPFLRYPVETNRLVCDKPLGYSGDFLVINYIYDFHNKYLGDSSYEKLINYYTCSIPISTSVVKRKAYFKERILKVALVNESPRILNIGSGSARELLELLYEKRIKRPLYFVCLDFEQRALNHIYEEIQKIPRAQRNFLKLELINKNIMSFIKNSVTDVVLGKYDYIYSSGLFDYLSKRISKRVIENLFGLLKEEGVLTITNVRANGATHRIYYEMLGEWQLNYRREEDLVYWTKDLHSASVKFDRMSINNSFMCLTIKRNSGKK